MALEHILSKPEKLKWENGKTAKDFSGLPKQKYEKIKQFI